MKTFLCNQRKRGLTLIELCVLIAVVAILYLLVFSGASFAHPRQKVWRLQCANNLKQTGLAFRVWAADHGDKFPMEICETNEGSLEFLTGPDLFQHFKVVFNELSTPVVLVCPADKARKRATNFTFFNNSNLSYFIGLNFSHSDPETILSGDCNITNGSPIRNGILELATNQSAAWTDEMHQNCGNLLLADGSVQQVGVSDLKRALIDTHTATNRLQMPLLTP
jgi:hypothetical protein